MAVQIRYNSNVSMEDLNKTRHPETYKFSNQLTSFVLEIFSTLKWTQRGPDSSSSNFLPCSEEPFWFRSRPGALNFFSSQDYFYSPSCQRASLEHGAHTKRETCRVTLHQAQPAPYPCVGHPLLPGTVSLGEACWCQQLLGRPHFYSAVCTSNTIRLDTGENPGCCQLNLGCN